MPRLAVTSNSDDGVYLAIKGSFQLNKCGSKVEIFAIAKPPLVDCFIAILFQYKST